MSTLSNQDDLQLDPNESSEEESADQEESESEDSSEENASSEKLEETNHVNEKQPFTLFNFITIFFVLYLICLIIFDNLSWIFKQVDQFINHYV